MYGGAKCYTVLPIVGKARIEQTCCRMIPIVMQVFYTPRLPTFTLRKRSEVSGHPKALGTKHVCLSLLHLLCQSLVLELGHINF